MGSRAYGWSLTLVNWCTMMCRQCRFMSSACVLSAASKIYNGRGMRNCQLHPPTLLRGQEAPRSGNGEREGVPAESPSTCSTFCTVTFISRFCLQ